MSASDEHRPAPRLIDELIHMESFSPPPEKKVNSNKQSPPPYYSLLLFHPRICFISVEG